MRLWLTIFGLLWAGVSHATTFEVIQGGGGDYTTIQACWNAIAAGDTCNVHAATYTEQLTVKSGTAGNLKTIQRNGSDVVIVTSTSKPVVSSTNNDYWKLDGLDIRYTGTGSAPAVILDTYDGGLTGQTTGWVITNCTLTLAGGTGSGFVVYIADAKDAIFSNNTLSVTATTGTHDGMDFLNANNLAITGNTLAGTASTSGKMEDGLVTQGADILIENNVFHDGWSFDNHPDGIVIQGNLLGDLSTDNVTIRNNTIYNFTQTIYIDCFAVAGFTPAHPTCTNINIYNNILYETASYKYGAFPAGASAICLIVDSEGAGIYSVGIYNNVLDCKFLAMRWLSPQAGSTFVAKNNLIFTAPSTIATGGATLDYNYYVMPSGDTAVQWGATSYTFAGLVAATTQEDHGLNTTTATLSMPATYIPDANANSIGRGVDLSAIFTTDYSGAIRSAPWDIGAYEFASSPDIPRASRRRLLQ